ncbi:C-type lectin domain family 10 member A-like [Nothobranchius furzeri]|uniref:C-type lectin domain family 10 member A-like n=1 Tax=Nothobranchius furzeri TaxID=105023 RepID=A0A9D2Y7G3_NOTFU|nr:C-type lectin domain family 10 member A-like [Nothobranchius furzeri]
MEEVYENVELHKSIHQNPLTNHRGSCRSKKKSGVAVLVFLGLLNVFLLLGLVILGVHSHGLVDITSDLSITNNNLTKRLQTSQDQLSNMTAERDLLNANLTEMTKELIELKMLSKKDKKCPAGWRMISCTCYLLSANRGSWDKGREDCRSRGAGLVVVNDADEQVGSDL